jgi:hypothetical protein
MGIKSSTSNTEGSKRSTDHGSVCRGYLRDSHEDIFQNGSPCPWEYREHCALNKLPDIFPSAQECVGWKYGMVEYKLKW